MAKSDQELLTATREAIDALTTGNVQSYSLNGQQFTRLQLPQLWDQVERLEARVARASRGRFGVGVRQSINGKDSTQRNRPHL